MPFLFEVVIPHLLADVGPILLNNVLADNTRMVLTADKGVSMVVMDREEYTQKSEELLHQPNYKILQADPTNKYKNKLISLLKSINQKVA